MMKAIRIHGYGGPEQLRYEDALDPMLHKGQILVRVYAASVNPVDYKLASGAMREFVPLPFPWIPGGDFAGTVERLGEGVTTLRPGDDVFGASPFGGAYARFVVAPADTAAPKPRKLNYLEAASVPIAGLTAWQGLFDHARLQPGQMILIHAAAGGVGSFAVQLAHWKKARVLATGSAANSAYLRELGSDEVIDYTKTRFETVAQDVDVVFDLVGGETQLRSFATLKRGGHLISAVQPPSQEAARNYGIHAMMMRMQASPRGLARLGELIDGGELKTNVTMTYPLSKVPEAWKQIMSGHTRGKMVVEIGSGGR